MHIDTLEEYPILKFFDQDSMTDHRQKNRSKISQTNSVLTVKIQYLFSKFNFLIVNCLHLGHSNEEI